ncbi:3-deoxy-D-manno-octulosonic acid transferase [Paracidovorax citrulli]|nr:3-deoxy-D-manno-octulosonic acid transferase [Paracidovorax citrulli]QCX12986.1 3-deoxy-D-manno-octulosonic acid transferase [Paracidovorax citrulli]UEG48036.1 3-deoxy-D-manno-octulosonic acid transferase [Paracidovorax citrulli]WIY36550.1 3-deoxy-D-manno-octulosonic acid transferase [Paracidovorax citrulli]SDK49605.1 3-deoxy-D-manno-octulosonic-acid transferase [Paracidovorax citrulli]
MSLARGLYSALMVGAQPLLRRKLRRRAAAEPGYGHAVDERFGRYGPSAGAPSSPLVWIHAVSLGETRAAAILLDALRPLLPDMRLLLTHGTATGRAEGAKLLRPGDIQAWQPWDTPGAVRRFLGHFRPSIGLLMETEIWPNLVAACRERGVPLALANARLNARSLAGARRLAWLSRPAYAALAAVWAQSEDDAARLREAGARVDGVFGNLKFDVVPDAAQVARGQAWRDACPRPVVLLASSREGEEAMWLQALAGRSLQDAAGEARAVQWLVVPRHPQRFAEVQAQLLSAGLTVSRRSAWAGEPEAADVWLGDSMGEMPLYYGLAHAALLGGSFAPLGGQNLIEAAACGCPVVAGPHTFNFAEAARLACEAGAALRVADMREGVQAAEAIATEPGRRGEAARAALAFAKTHRGAARATAEAAVALLHASLDPRQGQGQGQGG